MRIARAHEKLAGEDALSLFNTYGIGLDIICLISHSHGLEVDEEMFLKLLNEQKEREKGCKLC